MPASPPTLRLTFGDMILRVAEFLGVAESSGGVAVIPTDTENLDICKRIVNDGYRKFISANPKGWGFLKPVVSITLDPTGAGAQCVSSSAYRYYLPDGCVGEVLSPWTYAAGTGPYRRLDMVDEARIRELQATETVTGDPTLAAVRALPSASANTQGVRWELIVWPTPTTAYVISARCFVWPNQLATPTTDITICGWEYDNCVMAFALAEAERSRDGQIGVEAANARDALALALATDSRSAQRSLGDYGDKSEMRALPPRIYQGVDYYNSNAV